VLGILCRLDQRRVKFRLVRQAGEERAREIFFLGSPEGRFMGIP